MIFYLLLWAVFTVVVCGFEWMIWDSERRTAKLADDKLFGAQGAKKPVDQKIHRPVFRFGKKS